MSRATQTIGAGFRALGGANMASYSLEFLTQSGSRRPGTTETIVVPYAEMGRDRTCAIRFDPSEKTVSRKHAAISNENGQYFISPLSQTNQTFVNGAPIQTKVPLNNGSEIQLSSSGPRMRFLASQTKTSTLRLTQRMQMFASQSLRPYRRAVWSLAIVLIFSIAGLGYYLMDTTRNLEDAKKDIAKQEDKISNLEEMKNSLVADLQKVEKDQKKLKANIARQKKVNDSIRKIVYAENNVNDALANVENDVYIVLSKSIAYEIDGEIRRFDSKGLAGTGFLLNDGRFVTALHVIRPWYFMDSDYWSHLNALETAGNYVELKFEAISPSGKVISLSSLDFKYDIPHFKRESEEFYENGSYKDYVVRTCGNDGWQDDWAWAQTNERGEIIADPQLSRNLQAGKVIYTLGYTGGPSGQYTSTPNPLLGRTTVSQAGLDRGIIRYSGKVTAPGNSGGPAFVLDKKGNLKVVGIVSYGELNVLGGFVPVGSLK